jgi:putative ABC transport system ATP-binding protein
LSERSIHYPLELFEWEQQRVALTCAIIKNAAILLCDEPTGELDSENKQKIMDILQKIHRDHPHITIIIVTHDPDFKTIADRVFFIRDGKISYTLDGDNLEEFKQQSSYQGFIICQNGFGEKL